MEEEGVARAVAFEVDNVIAEADAAGADDFEADVDGAEEVEEMAAVEREGIAVGGKALADGAGTLTHDAAEEWGLIDEMAGVVTAAGFGEFLEQVEGAGAFRLEKGGVYGGDAFFAVDLVAGNLEDGLAGEGVDGAAVAGDKDLGGGLARGVTVTGFAAGEDERSVHAFDVPLPGPGNGFVEVVEVENELAVGGGEGAEVLDVGVAAELDKEGRVGEAGEVGGHDGNGAAEEGEG